MYVLLLIIVTDKKNTPFNMVEQRSKRSADEKNKLESKKSRKTICQRHSLYVDFNAVGFSSWIQRPEGYNAYYCYGSCSLPLASHLNTSNHAIMQTFLNFANPTVVSRPCCVPTKLSQLSALIMEDSKTLMMMNYPEMVVEECGCR